MIQEAGDLQHHRLLLEDPAYTVTLSQKNLFLREVSRQHCHLSCPTVTDIDITSSVSGNTSRPLPLNLMSPDNITCIAVQQSQRVVTISLLQ